MKTYSVTLPLIGLVTGTRAMAAGGLALVLADKLSQDQRRAIGWTLFGIGVASTIPLAAMLLGCGEKTSKPAE
jgi:hypothetical protein